jgi:hypothetical protein
MGLGFFNGRLLHNGQKLFVDNTSVNLNAEDAEIITTGTSTIVLPAIDGTVFDLHVYVKSGTCQITGTVDGVSNPVLQASTLEYDIFCNGIAYFTIPTEKENLFVNTKPQLASVSTYNQAGVIAINTILMTIDCRDCTAISISCNAMGTAGVVTPRWINEVGDTGQAATIMTPAGVAATTFNGAGMWVVPVVARYLTLVLTTATTAGTTTIRTSKLFGAIPSQLIPAIGTQAISGTVTANIGTGSLAAGTNAIGDVGAQVRANATGAASVTAINSPATPIGQSIKGTAGRILAINIGNTNAAARYLKIFNVASVTMGTTSAAYEIMIPPNSAPQNVVIPAAGLGASTAIVIAVTGGAGLTNNTAITANEVVGFISFA